VATGKMAINLEQDDDGTYLATDNFTTVYGQGKTPIDAIKDYWESLGIYYEILHAER
jgi:predicted RNase H-like HicB family nuclease